MPRQLGQYSDCATAFVDQGVRIPAGAKDAPFVKNVRRVLGSARPPVQWLPEALPGRKAAET
jgi:hypothetical protein